MKANVTGKSIYQELGQTSNPYIGMVSQIRAFKNTIQGDPRQMVEQLLSSGQMSQNQFNQYAQMAQQILPLLGE